MIDDINYNLIFIVFLRRYRWAKTQANTVEAVAPFESQIAIGEVIHPRKEWKAHLGMPKETLTLILNNLSLQNAPKRMWICSNKSLITWIPITMECSHPLISEKLFVNMVDTSQEEPSFTSLCVNSMLMMVVRSHLRNSLTWWPSNPVKKTPKRT